MKRFLLAMLLCLSSFNNASAQSDDIIIGKFLDAIVRKDKATLMKLAAKDNTTLGDIDKMILQSEQLQWCDWHYVHAYNTKDVSPYYYHVEEAESYIVAFKIGKDDTINRTQKRLLVTPSGHIFGYELLSVVIEDGNKKVKCSADILAIPEVEAILRKSNKCLPAWYYEWHD
jgi:hypothetical protein